MPTNTENISPAEVACYPAAGLFPKSGRAV